MTYNTELLNFFNYRASLVKQLSSSEDFVVNYMFLVGNKSIDNDNSIEITDIESLKDTVEEYFSKSNTDYRDRIFVSKFIIKDKPLFVHLMLS